MRPTRWIGAAASLLLPRLASSRAADATRPTESCLRRYACPLERVPGDGGLSGASTRPASSWSWDDYREAILVGGACGPTRGQAYRACTAVSRNETILGAAAAARPSLVITYAWYPAVEVVGGREREVAVVSCDAFALQYVDPADGGRTETVPCTLLR